MTEEKTLTTIPFSPELVERIEDFKKDWYKFYKKISKVKTPKYDGSGLEIIRRNKGTGYDYIIAAFMKDRLNHHFPGWSWKRIPPIHFIGLEWVVVDGELCVIDERLLAFNINPPYRYFASTGAARIQFKQGMPHTPENVAVDISHTVSSANTRAFKKGINELLGIGDDIYKWRIDEEGAGSMEDIITGATVASTDSQAKMFNEFLAKHKIPVSKALSALKIKSLAGITDYKDALDTLTKEVT